MLTALSLFSGIGGIEIAAERAGFHTVAFCEIEPFCREVLRKNFGANIPIYEDVCALKGSDIGYVDLICGGFPCQDISVAGKGEGLDGKRSGLWFEMLRLIREIRPRFVLAENVPALRSRGADTVLSSLEAAGYSAGAFVVGAADLRATHRRKRVWIVADRNRNRRSERDGSDRLSSGWEARRQSERSGKAMAEGGYPFPFPPRPEDFRNWATVANMDKTLMPCTELEVCNLADGVSPRLVRRRRRAILRALGNTVVPQVAYPFLKIIADRLKGEEENLVPSRS